MQRAGPSRRESLNQGLLGDIPERILCPVEKCPDSLRTSSSFYYDFPSIRTHLNGHCSRHLAGAVPREFLLKYEYSLCNICNKILHIKYKNLCQKCKPTYKRQEQINSMRDKNAASSSSSTNQQQSNAL